MCSLKATDKGLSEKGLIVTSPTFLRCNHSPACLSKLSGATLNRLLSQLQRYLAPKRLSVGVLAYLPNGMRDPFIQQIHIIAVPGGDQRLNYVGVQEASENRSLIVQSNRWPR